MANATTPPKRCARCSKSPNAPCNNTVTTALFRLSPCRARCSTESRTCVPHWRKTMSLHSPTATPRTSLRSTADDNRFLRTASKRELARVLVFVLTVVWLCPNDLIFINCIITFRPKFLSLPNFAYFCIIKELATSLIGI